MNESVEERSVTQHPHAHPASAGPAGSGPSTSSAFTTQKRKRLRKKKGVGLRKKLRVHMESVEEFNPEALDAQSAELERIRRLERQCSITSPTTITTTTSEEKPLERGVASSVTTTHHHSHYERLGPRTSPVEGGRGDLPVSPPPPPPPASKGSSSPELLRVEKIDLSQPPASAQKREVEPVAVEPILIESGSSDSDSNTRKSASAVGPAPPPQGKLAPQRQGAQRQAPQRQGVPQRRLYGKYDVFTPRPDGRVLVNEGHQSQERDVFLAPQIASIAKAHQVREREREGGGGIPSW